MGQGSAVAWTLCAALAGCSLERSPRASEPLPAPEPDAAVVPALPAPELEFEPIAYDEPFDRPTSLAFVPGSERELLVVQQHGPVLHLELDGDALRLLGRFELPDYYVGRDCGLIALAFDPDFERNAFAYLSLCTTQWTSGIFRFTFDPSDYSAIGESLREILVRGEEDAGNAIHNAGTIGFDLQGRMWALFGDKARSDNAADLASDLGKVLRILPGTDPERGGFEPAGNVFEDNPNLFAVGFRSPWRAALDGKGRLFVGDVGSSKAEEINLVRLGRSYGWPRYEGPCLARCAEHENPVAFWNIEDEEDPYLLDDERAEPTTRGVAWLGRFLDPAADDPYRGLLTDRLLFGDMCAGFVRALEVDNRGRVALDAHVGHRPHLTGIDQAPDGHLYALTYGSCAADRGRHPNGALWRVVLADSPLARAPNLK